MGYFLSSRRKGIIHVEDRDRKCCKNKRNVCLGQLCKISSNKAARNGRNGKIVEHVDGGPNSEPSVSESTGELLSLYKRLERPLPHPADRPHSARVVAVGGFRHRWFWCGGAPGYLARKKDEKEKNNSSFIHIYYLNLLFIWQTWTCSMCSPGGMWGPKLNKHRKMSSFAAYRSLGGEGKEGVCLWFLQAKTVWGVRAKQFLLPLSSGLSGERTRDTAAAEQKSVASCVCLKPFPGYGAVRKPWSRACGLRI